MQLIFRHNRLHERQFGHLMSVGLRILALQGVLTAVALPGLDRDDGVDILDAHA